MKTLQLPYSDTGFFSKLATDYLQGDAALNGLYAHRPAWESMPAAIAARENVQPNRDVLVSSLTQQYGKLNTSASVKQNIAALGRDNTFTVTTGHQLCLFTGPLYFIYKVVTTIRLAQQLQERFPDKQFVPVFWLASEDHDFAEINHATVFAHKLSWDIEAGGAVGRLATDTLNPVLKELESLLGDREEAAALNQLFRDAYLGHQNLADATRYLVNHLFGAHGLVVIDGDDAGLKAEFRAAMRDELLNEPAHTFVNRAAEQLSDAGHKVQVTPREINLFYLADGLRERLVREGDLWRVNNTEIAFSEPELLAELDQHPDRFSPNVVMRPLYQETVLPNIAYIGGGGELAYWLELKGVFDHFQVPMPMLVLRNSVLWIDGGSAKKMAKLELVATDLFAELETLKKQWVGNQSEQELSLEAERDEIARVFSNVTERAIEVDPTLKGVVEGEKTRTLKALEGLEKRLVKAEKQKHEVSLNQLTALHSKLFPGGGLQERHDNFIPLYLRYGQQFIESLLQRLEPLGESFTIIQEE